LSNVVEKGGYLREAVVNFRSDLATGEIKGFILDSYQEPSGGSSPPAAGGVSIEPGARSRSLPPTGNR